jgi:hypothetical protein
MTKSTDRYSQQLGCNVTNALRLLTRKLLFEFAKELDGRTICCRCGKKIENFREMSLDHQKNWINQPNAAELFWDVNNILLAHTKCNVQEKARRADKGSEHRRLRDSRNKRRWLSEQRSKDPVGLRAKQAARARASYNPEKRRQRYLQSKSVIH